MMFRIKFTTHLHSCTLGAWKIKWSQSKLLLFLLHLDSLDLYDRFKLRKKYLMNGSWTSLWQKVVWMERKYQLERSLTFRLEQWTGKFPSEESHFTSRMGSRTETHCTFIDGEVIGIDYNVKVIFFLLLRVDLIFFYVGKWRIWHILSNSIGYSIFSSGFFCYDPVLLC